MQHETLGEYFSLVDPTPGIEPDSSDNEISKNFGSELETNSSMTSRLSGKTFLISIIKIFLILKEKNTLCTVLK
jgi:hypothetical protein